MIRRRFLRRAGVSLSAGIAVAGCSARDGNGTITEVDGSDEMTTQPPTETPPSEDTPTPTPEPEPEFSSSVDWPAGGVIGQRMEVVVNVENTGDGAGDFAATLTTSDEELERETVTVESGESATITITHIPGMSGTFDVSVAGETATLTVYDTELTFVDDMMENVETLRIEREISESGQINLGEGSTNWAKDATTTVEKNFEAETMYKREEADLTVGNRQLEETTEQWVVNGVRYERKTKHTEGTVEFTREFTSEPTSGSVLDIHGTPTEGFLSADHSDEEFGFVFEPQTSEEATALMNRVIGPDGFWPAEQATDAYLEMRYDKRTGRATSAETEVTLEGAELFPELDATISDEFGAYGEPVAVEVPDEVINNAT